MQDVCVKQPEDEEGKCEPTRGDVVRFRLRSLPEFGVSPFVEHSWVFGNFQGLFVVSGL